MDGMDGDMRGGAGTVGWFDICDGNNLKMRTKEMSNNSLDIDFCQVLSSYKNI